MTELVIDTSVLYKADDTLAPEYWDAVSLLTKVFEEATVCIDAEGLILEEYRSVFAPGIQSHAFQWWRRQQGRQGGVHTISGRLTQKQSATFSKMGCDHDDVAFIGVALKAGIPIVHEDGDYEEACAKALGIVAHRLAVACTELGL